MPEVCYGWDLDSTKGNLNLSLPKKRYPIYKGNVFACEIASNSEN